MTLLSIAEEEDKVTNNLSTLLSSLATKGADVEIVESFINFGNIACSTSTAHVLHIKNNSRTVKAVYQVSHIISTDRVILVHDSFRCYHLMEYSLVKDLVV